MTPLETQALDASVKTAKSFFGKIFGPAADEFGMQLADNMRVRRMKNQIKNLEKVRAIVEQENITMKQIDLKALVPLLEGTALEENEDLQTMWANLFTNYIDAAKNLTTHVYPEILKQLSTEDVSILKRMQKNRNQTEVISQRYIERVSKETHAAVEQIANIFRLGLVAGVPKYKNSKKGILNDPAIVMLDPTQYRVTSFGSQFLGACTR